jgi:hypothetical protein
MKLWYQESAKLDITGVITKYRSTEIMNFWYQESVKLGRTGTVLEDRNHEETGYREIVTSDSNPNIANADVNYHVPCTQPEILHTAQLFFVGFNSRNKTMIKLLSSHNFARLTRWVPLLEQELLTITEHLSSPPVFT